MAVCEVRHRLKAEIVAFELPVEVGVRDEDKGMPEDRIGRQVKFRAMFGPEYRRFAGPLLQTVVDPSLGQGQGLAEIEIGRDFRRLPGSQPSTSVQNFRAGASSVVSGVNGK